MECCFHGGTDKCESSVPNVLDMGVLIMLRVRVRVRVRVRASLHEVFRTPNKGIL